MTTIVVLAAGLATRFGALKQLAAVGPSGEAIIDLTLADAGALGFDRAVVVVRRSIHDEVVSHVRARTQLPVVAVCQDEFGPPRNRPWGTVHALLSACPHASGPVVVLNADDYYGVDALTSAVSWSAVAGPGEGALIGFPVRATLPSEGPVSRAVCAIGVDGTLRGCVEHLEVVASAAGVRSERGMIADDAVVSMNLWAFAPDVVGSFERAWDRWLVAHRDDEQAECRIPDTVDELIARDDLTVTVRPTTSQWLGITYAHDVETVRAALRSRWTSEPGA